MNKGDLVLLLALLTVIVIMTIWLSIALTPIQESIIINIHKPTNVDVLPAHMNKDLTCHKIGLYTDWDEGWNGKSSGYLTGIYVGEHARQMFFEFDCSLVCYKYWESDKVCIAELYPHE